MNLVLNHGIFGFATFGRVTYFNGVKEHLTARFPGLRVLVAQVPAAGTIELRGAELGRQVIEAMRADGGGGGLAPDEPVHVIAHSMGGLDARFLLSPDNPANLADRIVSLTTISTPHRGSPVADLLLRLADPLRRSNPEKLFAESLRRRLSKAGIEIGGLSNLTTEGVGRFNARYRDDDRTVKFSVAGVGRRIRVMGVTLHTCAALGLAYRVVKEATGEENDGLVSLSSASWGTGPALWEADHADEIGHDLDGGFTAAPAHFNHLEKYEALVERLLHL